MRILVIEDDPEMGQLLTNWLEGQGFVPELVSNGLDGLIAFTSGGYEAAAIDVMLPGMNGFEFVTRTRADAKLSKIPAILVTSRNAVEDRRRGEQAGASAYIVKGEFDQNYLLRMARELVGWA